MHDAKSQCSNSPTTVDSLQTNPAAQSSNRFKVLSSICIIVSIVAASIEPIVVKLGFERQLLPLHLFLVKTVVGAIFILPLTRTFRWIGFKPLLRITYLSLLLLSTSALCIFALEKLSAVLVITIITTTPAFVAVCNQILGRDQLTPKFWTGFCLCFLGVCLGLDWSNIYMSAFGFALIFGAVATSTTYRVTMEAAVARDFTPALASTYMFIINGLLVSCLVLPFAGPIPAHAWHFGIWMGFVSACANVAFVYAISLLGSTRVSIINILQRPAIIIAAALILKEPITFQQGIGVALVLFGVQLAQSVKRKGSSAK